MLEMATWSAPLMLPRVGGAGTSELAATSSGVLARLNPPLTTIVFVAGCVSVTSVVSESTSPSGAVLFGAAVFAGAGTFSVSGCICCGTCCVEGSCSAEALLVSAAGVLAGTAGCDCTCAGRCAIVLLGQFVLPKY